MDESKVVIVSRSGYSSEHDSLIEELLDTELDLISIWGQDCELWEEVIDELAVGDASNIRDVTTSSHPRESLEEVIQFAEHWGTDKPSNVRIIEI